MIAAKKPPRVALSLDPATYAVIAKLASLQRRPKSTIAAELLLEMTPSLERVASLLEAAMRNRARLPTDTANRLEALNELLGHTATFALDRLEAAVTPPEANEPARRRSADRRRRAN